MWTTTLLVHFQSFKRMCIASKVPAVLNTTLFLKHSQKDTSKLTANIAVRTSLDLSRLQPTGGALAK